MDAPATAPEPSSHESTTNPASILTRKSLRGEFEYLLECLFHPFPTRYTVEDVFFGPKYPSLKYKPLELYDDLGIQSGECTCGRFWMSIIEPEGWKYYLLVDTSDTDSDNEDIGTNTTPENRPVEPTEPSNASDGDSETGATIGTGSDSATSIWDYPEARDCEEHGGMKGNLKRLCGRCKEEHGSQVMYCEEHGGWKGNLKRLCDACKKVYGDPYEVRNCLITLVEPRGR